VSARMGVVNQLPTLIGEIQKEAMKPKGGGNSNFYLPKRAVYFILITKDKLYHTYTTSEYTKAGFTI